MSSRSIYSRSLALIIVVAALILGGPALSANIVGKTVQFPSKDGLKITADVYRPTGLASSVIVLFHQARSSRGEYRKIAPELVKLGYMVLAIDQRAGRGFGGVDNETNQEAVMEGKGTGYTDAVPDLKASVAYARNEMGAKFVAVWWSSYSASLVLVLAGENTKFADAVLSFSPGEYFRGKPSVGGLAKSISVPTFITSARKEVSRWKPIFDSIGGGVAKTGYVPKVIGKHGSSALLPVKSPKTRPYWNAVRRFLKAHVPVFEAAKVK